jgi:hypothetical protein
LSVLEKNRISNLDSKAKIKAIQIFTDIN